MFRSSNENGEIETIVKAFCEHPVGRMITFDELSHRLGFNVRRRLYLVQAAKKRFEKEARQIVINIHGVGYACAEFQQYADVLQAARKSARLKLSRGRSRVVNAAGARNEQLPPEAAKRLSHEIAVAGILSLQMQDRHVARLNVESKPPSYSEVARQTLEMWNKV